MECLTTQPHFHTPRVASAYINSFEVMSRPTITLEATECLQNFRRLADLVDSQVKAPSDNGPSLSEAKAFIKDSTARFQAWGINIAAFQDGQRRTSLDFRLKDASEIAHRTLRILDNIQEYISDREYSLIYTSAHFLTIWSYQDIYRSGGR